MKKQSNLSRLMGYAGKHRILTYLSWVLSAVSALLTLVPFWYIWRIIHDILQVSPDYSQAQSVTHYGWMAVLFAVISIVVYITALMCSHLSAFRIASNIRKELMRHIAELPLGVTEKYGSGKLRRIVNDSSKATETYLAHRLPDKAGAVATPVGLLFLLLIFDWRLGLLSLVPVILGFLIMMKMTGAGMEQKMKEYQNSLSDMSNEAVEYVRGIPVVKTFGQTIFSFKRFKASIDNYEKWVIAYTRTLRLPMLITPVIGTTLTKIMFMSEDAMIVNDAIGRIDELLNEKTLSESLLPKEPADNSIVLEHVSYSYKADHSRSEAHADGRTESLPVQRTDGGRDAENALNDVSLSIRPGQMNYVSFVFQNSRLIKASILENVRMARPEASRGEVIEALKTAQCTDIIEKLPKGIDTVVGTKGVYLSGGEQQRIAIARAVLKNAPILILDEATAFADPDNEVRVQKALSALSEGKTVIMIAHRLSSITNADSIYVMHRGRIVESGTHRELLEKNGLFSHMWKNYSEAAEWKIAKEAKA